MQLQHFRIVVASKSNYPDIGLREKMQEVSCHLNGKNHQKSGFPAKIIKDFHKPTLGKHRKTMENNCAMSFLLMSVSKQDLDYAQ